MFVCVLIIYVMPSLRGNSVTHVQMAHNVVGQNVTVLIRERLFRTSLLLNMLLCRLEFDLVFDFLSVSKIILKQQR